MTASLEEHYVRGALRLKLIFLKASKSEGLLLKSRSDTLQGRRPLLIHKINH